MEKWEAWNLVETHVIIFTLLNSSLLDVCILRSIHYHFSKDFWDSYWGKASAGGKKRTKMRQVGRRSTGTVKASRKDDQRVRKDCWAWGWIVSRYKARPQLLEPGSRGRQTSVFQCHPSIPGWEQLYFLLIRFRITSWVWGWIVFDGGRCEDELATIADSHCARKVAPEVRGVLCGQTVDFQRPMSLHIQSLFFSFWLMDSVYK